MRIADQSGRGTSCGTRANRPQALVCCLIGTLALAAAPAGATAWQLPWTTSRLTDTAWGELDPVVSPDGTKILYTHVLPGRYDIYQVNSDGSGPHDLVANSSQMASYTVDGTHVLYDRWLDGGIFKIPVAGGPSTLVIDTQREPCTRPNELPNGCIVFERWWTVPMSIWVADPQDPGHLVRIADHAEDRQQPRVSPCGRYVAYHSQAGDGTPQDIFLWDLGLEQETRLTFEPEPQGFPSFSPDGEWLAYQSREDGGERFDIWMLSVSDPRTRYQLTDGGVDGLLDCCHPAFDPSFPDNSRIVFVNWPWGQELSADLWEARGLPIPEPTTSALLALALLPLVRRRRP